MLSPPARGDRRDRKGGVLLVHFPMIFPTLMGVEMLPFFFARVRCLFFPILLARPAGDRLLDPFSLSMERAGAACGFSPE